MPAYEPGDSLDLYAENDPAYVDELLKLAGLSDDEKLRAELIKSRDVTTLSLKAVETYAAQTGHQYVKALIADGQAKEWIAGRQLIDLIAMFPIALTADHLRAVTRPLAPRAYSIASSRREVGDEAHLLISAVRYETNGRARKGVASNYAAERLKRGSRVRVKLKPNKHFALPAQDKDIIMVGPGTGVAPFRAFVQERRAVAAEGRSWLFFGDRQYTHDFLYQLDWQDALKDGALTRMDVAFSRDTPEKIYVQDKMWEKPPRPDRMARRRRQFLCMRRCQEYGKGRARDVGARLCRGEGAVAGSRRTGGGEPGARQALPAGHLLRRLRFGAGRHRPYTGRFRRGRAPTKSRRTVRFSGRQKRWPTKSCRRWNTSRRAAAICAATSPRTWPILTPAGSARTAPSS